MDCVTKSLSSVPHLDLSASWADGALVRDSTQLCARVIGKRQHLPSGDDGDDEEFFTYVINDGVFGSFGRTLLDGGGCDAQVQVSPLFFDDAEGGVSAPCRPTDLWGCSGDDLDVLARRVRMPEVEVGEWVVFGGMGAGVVTASAASVFDAFEAPEEWRGGKEKEEGELW